MADLFSEIFGFSLSDEFDTDTKQPFSRNKRDIKGTTTFARVVVYHYDRQNFGRAVSVKRIAEFANIVATTTTHVIESEVESIRLSKSIGRPSGNFEISLLPTNNWKRFISPGDWILVYLYNSREEFNLPFLEQAPPPNNLAWLGNVDRVAKTKQKDERTDKTLVRYRVGGRDFGKVFEQTDIWFNPYKIENLINVIDTVLIKAGIPFNGRPDQLVEAIIDVFLNPLGGEIGGLSTGTGRTLPLGQWILPAQILIPFAAIPTGIPAFHNILKLKLEAGLPGFKPKSMITPKSNGSLWGIMQRNSNAVVNEMFTQLVRKGDGTVEPSIVLRPRPTSAFFEDVPGKLNDKFRSLQDLASVSSIVVNPTDIVFEDLGKDSQSRVNMVWLNARQSEEYMVNHYANVYANSDGSGIGLPMLQKESVQRYGLKRLETTLDFVYEENGAKNFNVDAALYKSFIAQVYDQNAFNHLYETGTIETVGQIKAEIGKVLIVPPINEGPPDKIYYIEGYTHNWRFPDQWRTEFTVTMGQFNDASAPFIDVGKSDFGQDDIDLTSDSLVKTTVGRLVGLGPSPKKNNASISGFLSETFGTSFGL